MKPITSLILSLIYCGVAYKVDKQLVATKPNSSCKSDCPSGSKCILDSCVLSPQCPVPQRYGDGPPVWCSTPVDPLNKTKSDVEFWFTEDIFNDLFPKANIGWGPDNCFPYSFKSLQIAARYFPKFGTEQFNNGYSQIENNRRDFAAFLAHVIQETGENDISLYQKGPSDQADACFYRGGFYNWFEGGPTSAFLPKSNYQPSDGAHCTASGVYCVSNQEYDYFYPCNKSLDGGLNIGCYFGRGALQISYNFNYGQFQTWLHSQGIDVDLLNDPNLLMTKTDPPLAMMASLWFYMTPQPPKPAMHDIILGNWEPGPVNDAAGYVGPILGPTSLVINNECNGEDQQVPGGPGENRRIKAFKWFCNYFNVPVGDDKYLTCKNMPQKLDQIQQMLSWEPDWTTAWKSQPCNCSPASYGGMIPYYQPGFYPDRFVAQNNVNRLQCIELIYQNPSLFNMNNATSTCLLYQQDHM